MPENIENNPVIPRLAKLAEQWLHFENETNGTIGRWLVKPEEYRMIEVFYEVEQNEGGNVPSLFLKFKTSFTDSESYTLDTFKELTQTLESEENQEAFKEIGLDTEELEIRLMKPIRQNWLKLMEETANRIPALDGYFVAFLNPEENADPKKWVNWIMDLIDLGLPPKVKIMLVDIEGSSLFDPIDQYYPGQMITLRPELDLDNMLQEMASLSGKNPPDDPGVLFRQAFVKLMQSSQPGKIKEAQAHAADARKISQEQNWPHLETGVLIALASAFMNNKMMEEAIGAYEDAFEASKKVEEDENLKKRLGIQCLMGKGTVYVQLMEYPDASVCYEQAGEMGLEMKDYYLALESWRMAGFSREMDKDFFQAWDNLQQALEAVKQIPDKDKPNTTLPFVGEALLRLAGKTRRGKVKPDIHIMMENWLGTDWLDKLKITKGK